MLSEGTTAPDFTLSGLARPDEDGGRQMEEFHLTEFASGSPTLLAFYPGDFSPVCTEELCSLRDIELSELDESRDVYGISRDSLFTHEAFAYDHDISFPLLSDVQGKVCKSYDAVHQEDAGDGVEAGLAKRTVYVLDSALTIVHAWQTDDPSVAPDIDEVVDEMLAAD
ncbi:MAG: peroxiredoxin [Natronomonas sp.]|jgi:peroxiredoxin|uniref:redoxin domain-containing protein n=1 Tax=Natronomonas sp. TaxID=2184060 RepID=UPI00398A3D85